MGHCPALQISESKDKQKMPAYMEDNGCPLMLVPGVV